MPFSLPTMRQPRNPLLRVLSVLVGIAVIGVFLFFSLVVFSALLVGGVLLVALRRWRHRNARVSVAPGHAAPPAVLEGEFVVLKQGRPTTH